MELNDNLTGTNLKRSALIFGRNINEGKTGLTIFSIRANLGIIVKFLNNRNVSKVRAYNKKLTEFRNYQMI